MFEIDGVKVTDRGWAGHLIFADACKFRRNTLLEYKDKKWIISTVGCCVNSLENKIMTIGYNRYYETMAFEAEKEGAYYDANVEKEIDFDSKWAVDHWDRNADNEANDMHDAVVKELIQKIKE